MVVRSPPTTYGRRPTSDIVPHSPHFTHVGLILRALVNISSEGDRCTGSRRESKELELEIAFIESRFMVNNDRST